MTRRADARSYRSGSAVSLGRGSIPALGHMSGVSPQVCVVVAVTALLVGCSQGATSSAPTEPTGATAAAPADLARPVGIVAIGHSGEHGLPERSGPHHPEAKADYTRATPLAFDAAGTLRESGVGKLSTVIDECEAETARVCARVPHCRTDGGVRKAYIDTIGNFSPDYAHLNAKGQAAEAALIWPVVEALLTQ